MHSCETARKTNENTYLYVRKTELISGEVSVSIKRFAWDTLRTGCRTDGYDGCASPHKRMLRNDVIRTFTVTLVLVAMEVGSCLATGVYLLAAVAAPTYRPSPALGSRRVRNVALGMGRTICAVPSFVSEDKRSTVNFGEIRSEQGSTKEQQL